MRNAKFMTSLGLILVGAALLSGCNSRVVDAREHFAADNVAFASTAAPSNTGRWHLVPLGQIPSIATDDSNPRIDFSSRDVGWLWGWTDLWRTTDGGRSWTHADKSTLERGLPPWIQMFSDDLVGWRINFDKVEQTADGGKNWRQIDIPKIGSDSDTMPDGVVFQSDGRHGWLGLHYFVDITPGQRASLHLGAASVDRDGTRARMGAIFYTADGGQTWSRQPIKTDVGYGISHIWIEPNGVPWAISQQSLFYLENGHWEKVDYTRCTQNTLLLKTLKVDLVKGRIYYPTWIYFINQTTGWATFSNGYIAKTIDGGKSWCDLALVDKFEPEDVLPFWFYKVVFVDPDNGVGVGTNYRLYSTSDGGANWTKIPSTERFVDVAVRDGFIWATSDTNLYSLMFESR